MIIGTIELDPEDPSKQIKITDDIGFNPSTIKFKIMSSNFPLILKFMNFKFQGHALKKCH